MHQAPPCPRYRPPRALELSTQSESYKKVNRFIIILDNGFLYSEEPCILNSYLLSAVHRSIGIQKAPSINDIQWWFTLPTHLGDFLWCFSLINCCTVLYLCLCWGVRSGLFSSCSALNSVPIIICFFLMKGLNMVENQRICLKSGHFFYFSN